MLPQCFAPKPFHCCVDLLNCSQLVEVVRLDSALSPIQWPVAEWPQYLSEHHQTWPSSLSQTKLYSLSPRLDARPNFGRTDLWAYSSKSVSSNVFLFEDLILSRGLLRCYVFMMRNRAIVRNRHLDKLAWGLWHWLKFCTSLTTCVYSVFPLSPFLICPLLLS